MQFVRSRIFPFKRRKVENPEIICPVASPVKRKERSLSSLTIPAPQVSIQKCLTKRRTKASCLRNFPLVCSSLVMVPLRIGCVKNSNFLSVNPLLELFK